MLPPSAAVLNWFSSCLLPRSNVFTPKTPPSSAPLSFGVLSSFLSGCAFHHQKLPLKRPMAMAMTSGTLHLHAICNGMLYQRPLPACSFHKAQRINFRAGGEQCVEETKIKSQRKRGEALLFSVAPFPLLLASTLPGAEVVRSVFEPFVELVKTWNLPEWLVHWGHPGNMAVVLFAMGGYGTYLGFRIRLSKDAEEKAKAKDLHPKLLGGMFFFFALGATGGITALLTSEKPIFESPHAVTGILGLGLLTVQSILPIFFEENRGMRTVHGLLGSSIMTLFVLHAALGLQLGLSF